MSDRPIVVVRPNQTGSTASLVDDVVAGASDPTIGQRRVILLDALDVTATDVSPAAGLILATSENFGYMAGAIKHCLEQIYYPLLEASVRLPYALVVKAGNDGSGAVRSIEPIMKGLSFSLIAEPLVIVGDIENSDRVAARELGQTFAAGLEAGLW
ncbi:MAG: flavodoxin [Acidobacteria bacterium]|nr:flavodoxin [Acidobacteriota bacterium]